MRLMPADEATDINSNIIDFLCQEFNTFVWLLAH